MTVSVGCGLKLSGDATEDEKRQSAAVSQLHAMAAKEWPGHGYTRSTMRVAGGVIIELRPVTDNA